MINADPTHNEAKMKLAELYEIMDEPRKALDLVYQGNEPYLRCQSLSHADDPTYTVIDSRGKNRNVKEQDDTSHASGGIRASLFKETLCTESRERRGNAQLRELEEWKEKDLVRASGRAVAQNA